MKSRINRFEIKKWEYDFTPSYLNSSELLELIKNSDKNEIRQIAQQWITEGIPYAFKNSPLLYEKIRVYMSTRLNVLPKEITIVGSSRIGYSMKPNAWGRPLNQSSDLDFTIVSNQLYSELVSDFQKWVKDLGEGTIIPLTEDQLSNWLNSIMTVNANIPKGYIYTRDLFAHKKYPNISKCHSTLRDLREILLNTPDSPKLKKSSIRIYSSWDKCINQIQINIENAANKANIIFQKVK